MDIAGIHFTVRHAELPVLPDPWPTYAPFLAAPPMPDGGLNIELDVVLGGMPGFAGLQKEFDGESWSLFRSGGDYVFSLNPRTPELPPPWTARVNPEFTRATVYCDPVLVREERGVRGIINPLLNRLDQLLIMYVLARHGGALIHAAGAGFGGKALLFAGRSGAGKSTISRQFAASGRSGLELLSDDRMILRDIGGAYRAFGTPWAGDAGIAAHRGLPLKAIFFLARGGTNEAEPLGPVHAFERMLPLVSVPWYDRDMVVRVTDFCERVTRAIPAYELRVVPTPEIAGFVESVAGELHD